ncbi:heat shock protein [Perkinsela sp. CCAP 1560/4]|nr:heat shock protein [Perkinsela sp. CCAP 1560/4]|eukprot:KNH09223.1 heat shock protein [Perkinsela sp. CCAP 1560/4]
MFSITARYLTKSIRPLGKRVLIRRTEALKETKTGILIPEQAQGKLNEGTVIAVAAATSDWKPSVKVGDTVLLNEYGGTAVKVDGVAMQLFNEDQLLGIVEK